MGAVKEYYNHKQKEIDSNLLEWYMEQWKKESVKKKADKIKDHFKKDEDFDDKQYTTAYIEDKIGKE